MEGWTRELPSAEKLQEGKKKIGIIGERSVECCSSIIDPLAEVLVFVVA